jgi:hypothetical protein
VQFKDVRTNKFVAVAVDGEVQSMELSMGRCGEKEGDENIQPSFRRFAAGF